MRFKIGDRVRIIGSEYADEEYVGKCGTVVEIDNDEYHIDLNHGDSDIAYTRDLDLVGDELLENKMPSKLYQLYGYYSKKENRKDKFIYHDNAVVFYDGREIQVRILSNEDEMYLSDAEYLSTMFDINIEPYEDESEDEATEMTLEQIEQDLGFKIKIVNSNMIE